MKKFNHIRPFYIAALILIMTEIVAVIAVVKLNLATNTLLSRSQETIIAQSQNPPTKTVLATDTVKKDDLVWGVSKQTDEKTWTMRVGEDSKMATEQEIFDAINNYRKQRGLSILAKDDNLATFAKKRANTFVSINGLDEHAGFSEYFKSSDNMKAVGMNRVGENSSFGFKLEGVHLIEWIFAGDEPHNNNQLDPEWEYIGIGVTGTAVDIVFGMK